MSECRSTEIDADMPQRALRSRKRIGKAFAGRRDKVVDIDSVSARETDCEKWWGNILRGDENTTRLT